MRGWGEGEVLAGVLMAMMLMIGPGASAALTDEPTGEQIIRRVTEADGVQDEKAHVTFTQVGADKREQTTFGLLHYKQSEKRDNSSGG